MICQTLIIKDGFIGFPLYTGSITSRISAIHSLELVQKGTGYTAQLKLDDYQNGFKDLLKTNHTEEERLLNPRCFLGHVFTNRKIYPIMSTEDGKIEGCVIDLRDDLSYYYDNNKAVNRMLVSASKYTRLIPDIYYAVDRASTRSSYSVPTLVVMRLSDLFKNIGILEKTANEISDVKLINPALYVPWNDSEFYMFNSPTCSRHLTTDVDLMSRAMLRDSINRDLENKDRPRFFACGEYRP